MDDLFLLSKAQMRRIQAAQVLRLHRSLPPLQRRQGHAKRTARSVLELIAHPASMRPNANTVSSLGLRLMDSAIFRQQPGNLTRTRTSSRSIATAPRITSASFLSLPVAKENKVSL